MSEAPPTPPPPPVQPMRATAPGAVISPPLGALAELPGVWVGEGFNLIALPDKQNGKTFRVMLNATIETMSFSPIGGPIPNRGSLQNDIFLHGLHYLQQVSDAQTFAALHLEPGLWLNVPPTEAPPAPATIVRQATVPHGDSLLAQSVFVNTDKGGPQIAPVSTLPVRVNGKPLGFGYTDPYQNALLPPGIPSEAVQDPNVVLTQKLAQQEKAGLKVVETTTIVVKTAPAGGIINIPFIVKNADAISMEAIFWIERVSQPNAPDFMQLQYTQTVMLRFNEIDWPHVSVATLVNQ